MLELNYTMASKAFLRAVESGSAHMVDLRRRFDRIMHRRNELILNAITTLILRESSLSQDFCGLLQVRGCVH